MNPENDIEKIFKKEIEAEIITSEILRSKILAVFFLFVGTYLTLFARFNYDQFKVIFTDRVYPYLPSIFFPLLSIYFIGLTIFLIQFKKSNKNIPSFPRYANAFIEISIPSLVLIFLAEIRFETPLYVLLAPPALAYFMLIILSALRLDFKISIFTSLVAGIEYILIAMYYSKVNYVELPSDFIVALPAFLIRSIFMIVSGFIVAYVTLQIQKRLLNSFAILNERNKITSLFGQHVSPEVVKKLTGQNEFTSEIKHVCIMFFDIRNFTSFSEKKTPGEVVEYLNKIFDFSIEIINEHNGIINKFLGDGFMAVFGAPISNGDDVKNSVNASIAILKKIQLECESLRLENTSVGIGLHSGEAVTGNIGSIKRKEYTIIGDVVNLASRVEQLNKSFNSKLLITEEVKSFLDASYTCEYIDEVLVKGREQKVKIYKLA